MRSFGSPCWLLTPRNAPHERPPHFSCVCLSPLFLNLLFPLNLCRWVGFGRRRTNPRTIPQTVPRRSSRSGSEQPSGGLRSANSNQPNFERILALSRSKKCQKTRQAEERTHGLAGSVSLAVGGRGPGTGFVPATQESRHVAGVACFTALFTRASRRSSRRASRSHGMTKPGASGVHVQSWARNDLGDGCPFHPRKILGIFSGVSVCPRKAPCFYPFMIDMSSPSSLFSFARKDEMLAVRWGHFSRVCEFDGTARRRPWWWLPDSFLFSS